MSVSSDATICALDVGDKRIGMAQANVIALFPQPCAVIAHDDTVIERLTELLRTHHAIALVIGLPRSLQGDDTAQTESVHHFISRVRSSVPSLPLYLQDEAGTTKQAEEELAQRKSPARADPRSSKDALAASYILEDFIQEGKHNELLS